MPQNGSKVLVCVPLNLSILVRSVSRYNVWILVLQSATAGTGNAVEAIRPILKKKAHCFQVGS